MALASAENEPVRIPALFLEFLPAAWDEVSRRARFTGRTVEAVMDRSLAEFGACFALVGGFLADMEGEGDEFDDVMPFVWIPGGTGRFILAAPFC